MTVRIAGGEVIKRLPPMMPVETLVQRTRTLRRAGVATPAAGPGPMAGEVRFDRIEGTAGLTLIVGEREAALDPILEALAVLHCAPSDKLPSFRADAKIRPRLGPGSPAWIAPALDRWLPRGARRTATLHGDFHAGQLIRDHAGRVWILDLDDLAAGPPEADLGNFAAHLATRPESRCPTVAEGFETWLGAILRAYPGATDPDLAWAHGRIALIRRALKLAERGEDAVLAEVGAILGAGISAGDRASRCDSGACRG